MKTVRSYFHQLGKINLHGYVSTANQANGDKLQLTSIYMAGNEITHEQKETRS